MSLGPNFRNLLSAAGIGNLGDGVAVVAYPWLASLITRDPFLIGLFAAISRLPWFLFALPAGVMADRYDRQRLIVAASSVQAALTVAVTVLVLTSPAADNITLYWIMAGLVFGIGAAEVVRDNAAQTLLPAIVAKTDLETANGRLWSVETVANSFLGPPLAGLLIAVSLPLSFAFDAVTFAIAAFLVARIRIPKASPQQRQPVLPALKEGFLWLWSNRIFRDLALCLGLMNMVHMMALAILVLFVQDVLALSSWGYGLLLTGAAAGAVLGGLIAPRIIARIGSSHALFSAISMLAAGTALIAASSVPALVWLGLLIESFGAMQWNIVTVSLRQRAIPSRILGRVNSVYRFFGWGMMPAGSLLGGILVALLETPFGREIALRFPFWFACLAYVVLLMFARRHLGADALAKAEQG